MMLHGTSGENAEKIQTNGLVKGSYVTNDFEFAAGYALRHKGDATILAFDNIPVTNPDESAYWGEVEFVTTEKARPVQRLVPKFDSANLPEDYYDLNDDLSERKYPHFFSREYWGLK